MVNRYKYLDDHRRHLHTLDEKPLFGTSSVAKMIGGEKVEQLLGWAARVGARAGVLLAAALDTETLDLLEAELLKRPALTNNEAKEVDSLVPQFEGARKAHITKRDAAGVKGTDRHALLEDYVKECMRTNEGRPFVFLAEQGSELDKSVVEFADWSMKNVKKFLWSELHAYNEELWCGGIADVGWIDTEDRVIAGDFKSSRGSYFDQFVQIAGYDLEISHSGGLNKEGDVIFTLPKPIEGYCVIPFGSEPLVPEFVYALEGYKATFRALVVAVTADKEHATKVIK